MRQSWFWVKKKKLRCAFNYLWTIAFTKEDGFGLFDRFFIKHNPDLTPYPWRIELETTNKCRFHCLKCEHTYWDEKPRDMSFEEFKHIVDQFPNLTTISVSGIGHGFENKEFMKMLRYMKSKGVFVQFFDTFMLTDEEKARELIQIGVDKIWMSIDAATKETYEKLHVGSNFELAVANFRRLVQLKKEARSQFPWVCFHYIVQKPNVTEMPQFIDFIHSITADDPAKLRLVQFTRLIPFKENEFLYPHIPPEIVDETLRRAKKYGNFKIDMVNISEPLKKPPICECTSWTVPFITVDCVVYPCCALTEGNQRKAVEKFALGNIFKTPFKEMWYSKRFREVRRMINQNKAPVFCYWPRECPQFDTGITKVVAE